MGPLFAYYIILLACPPKALVKFSVFSVISVFSVVCSPGALPVLLPFEVKAIWKWAGGVISRSHGISSLGSNGKCLGKYIRDGIRGVV